MLLRILHSNSLLHHSMCLLMHFLLALNKSATIQSIYSITNGQYRISITGKTITDCLPSTKLRSLFGKSKVLKILKTKNNLKAIKQLIANN